MLCYFFRKPDGSQGRLDFQLVSEALSYPHPDIEAEIGRMVAYTFRLFLLRKEPIGSAAPQFSTRMDLFAYKVVSGRQIGLLCPAMGSPVPGFR